MLRNYWQSATTAIATINENISTALEGLDKEMDGVITNPTMTTTTSHSSIDDNFNLYHREDDIREELETYKKLLEDAQMQHVQLSKHLGSIIASKDAEINLLLLQSKVTNDSSKISSESNLPEDYSSDEKTIKLIQEKVALEKSLEDFELRYQEALRSSNEGKVLFSKYESLSRKFNEIEMEYNELKQRSDSIIKQKSDDIENLVAEYSKLAADCELRQTVEIKKLQDVITENEILVTKIQALEHSITQFADRAVANESIQRNVSENGIYTNGSSSPSEIKELRAKLVNTQFDLKQRDDAIVNLKLEIQRLQSMTSSHSLDVNSSGSNNNSNNNSHNSIVSMLEKQVAELMTEKSNMSADIERLIVEKREAEDAGKNFFEQGKTYRKDIDALKAQLQYMQQQRQSPEIESLQLKLETLSTELLEKNKSCNMMTTEIEELRVTITSKDKLLSELQSTGLNQVHNLQQEVEKLSQSILLLSKERDDMKQKLLESEESRNQLQSHIHQLKHLEAVSKSESGTVITQMEEMHAKELLSLQQLLEDTENRLLQEHNSHVNLLKDAKNQEIESSVQTAIMKEKQEAKSVYDQMESKLQSKISKLETKCYELEQIIEQAAQSLSQQKTNYEFELKQSQDKIQKLQVEVEDIKRSTSEMLSTKDKQLAEHLESLRKDLENQLKLREEELNGIHLNDKKITIEHMESQAADRLAKSLAKLDQESKLHLQESLEQLRIQKDSEKEEALQNAKIETDKMHQEQLEEAKREANIVLETLRRELEGRIEMLQVTTQKAIDDLHNIEKRYEVKMKDALIALEVKKDDERTIALATLRSSMQKLIDEAVNEKEEYLAMYTKENKLRKSIHNKLLELQGNIRVICRVRPILDMERKTGEDVDVTSFPSPEDLVIQRDPVTKSRYEYDRVFSPGSTQLQVFEAVQPLVVSVLDGYNICIFAYGQTGSGKTYTMEGYNTDYGISPRAIGELFRLVQEMEEDWTYTLTFSMLEIYNETILDLLDSNPNKDKLDVRQTPDGNTVPGLTEVMIYSPEQVKELMTQGQANRAVGSHDMNERSSRSHSILTVVCRGKNKVDGTTTFGKLNLIDLAGSERISKTDATGDRLKEAQNINRSLSALGDVISALGNKKNTHVPYRNSKLTFLLQDSLGGNSKVLMFVNISPAIYNIGESLCSLNFASRCRNVELGQASKKVTVGDSSDTSAVTSSSGTSSSKSMSPASSSTSLSTSTGMKRTESSSLMSSSSNTTSSGNSTGTSTGLNTSSRRISTGLPLSSTRK